jgi:hypothetical protein
MNPATPQHAQGEQVGVARDARDGPISTRHSPEAATDESFLPLAKPFDVQMKDGHGRPNDLDASELHTSPNSSCTLKGEIRSHQVTTRPWAKDPGRQPGYQLAYQLGAPPTTPSVNSDPLLRWYSESSIQGPFHGIGSACDSQGPNSLNSISKPPPAMHLPSQNSAVWGSSGQCRG